MGAFTIIISFVILGCGLYVLYAWYTTGTTGEINGVLLLGRHADATKCKNKEEFLEKFRPMMLTLGIVTTVYGVVDISYTLIWTESEVLGRANLILIPIALATVIIFGSRARKLQAEYFS